MSKQQKHVRHRTTIYKDVLEALREKASRGEAYQDRLLRMTAEFENYKKRNQRELEKLKELVLEDFLRELLPVIDDLERAIAVGTSEAKNDQFLEGIILVQRSLLGILERFGVQRIKALGEVFDPNIHDAVATEEGEGGQDMISEEIRPGYIYRGKLLRPSMVKVAVGRRQ